MSEDHAHQPTNIEDYPLHMIVGIVPPSAVPKIIATLTEQQVPDDAIEVAQGVADAEQMGDAGEEGILTNLAHIFASTEEHTQRDQYAQAIQAGNAVVRIKLEDETKKREIGQILADNGGHFINYYGRWAIETLIY
ncbi:MAG: hypothetical protein SH847_21600 [Roseiflexaceae bacterium]|nr:hypothetical protein [Roseiflexaceae bacterium]